MTGKEFKALKVGDRLLVTNDVRVFWTKNNIITITSINTTMTEMSINPGRTINRTGEIESGDCKTFSIRTVNITTLEKEEHWKEFFENLVEIVEEKKSRIFNIEA